MLEAMREIDERDMEAFSTLDTNAKAIDVLSIGDRWRPHKENQEGDNIAVAKTCLCDMCKQRKERQTVGGVSIRSRNGASSRKGGVVPW